MMCVEHDLMTRLPLDVGDKTYAARIFFLRRVIEPIFVRVTARLYDNFIIHLYLLFILTMGFIPGSVISLDSQLGCTVHHIKARVTQAKY